MNELHVKRLAYHLLNARPDCYQPRKRERETQWDHCVENVCNFLRNEIPNFERSKFITSCGGLFKPEGK